MSEPELNAKFRAKRANEHVKSLYSFANTIAAAVILTGFIAPGIARGSDSLDLDARGWVLIGLFVHAVGHLII